LTFAWRVIEVVANARPKKKACIAAGLLFDELQSGA
jgi:hypothetical protein